MRCAGCGQPLTAGVSVCLKCGTPCPRDFTPPAGEVAVALLPDPVLPSGDNWPDSVGPTSPYTSAGAAIPPPPPLYTTTGALGTPPYVAPTTIYHPRWQRFGIILAAAVLVLGLGGFGAYRYAHASGWLGHSTAHSGGGVGSATAIPTNTQCALPDVDRAAQLDLAETQLTTGLKDIKDRNFAPINDVNNFKIGDSIYVTFVIANNASATLSADWCWGNGQHAQYNMNLNHNENVRGYFTLSNVDATAVGAGTIVIKWNDTVAVALPFRVAKP